MEVTTISIIIAIIADMAVIATIGCIIFSPYNFEFLYYFTSGDLLEIDDVRVANYDYNLIINDIKIYDVNGKETYALRSQTIERVFADAKEKHSMRYTPYRGLAAVTAWVKLKFAALNLKKFAIHKWMRSLLLLAISMIEATSQICKVASLTI